MTNRTTIALHLLQGLLANPELYTVTKPNLVELAYEYADLMIEKELGLEDQVEKVMRSYSEPPAPGDPDFIGPVHPSS